METSIGTTEERVDYFVLKRYEIHCANAPPLVEKIAITTKILRILTLTFLPIRLLCCMAAILACLGFFSLLMSMLVKYSVIHVPKRVSLSRQLSSLSLSKLKIFRIGGMQQLLISPFWQASANCKATAAEVMAFMYAISFVTV